MNRWFCCLLVVAGIPCAACADLRSDLEASYGVWRQAVVRKDANAWQAVTAMHRRIEVKNRVLSEKKPYPAAVFDLPAPPPSLEGISFLDAQQSGPTAKACYFGKVDFGVGGEPTENLLVLSFVRGRDRWLYDRADFVNLAALPEVRKELAAGDLRYLKETPETKPTGMMPPVPSEIGAAKYIAKVYVFCPGREVQVRVNRISRHRFTNAKEAEVVIGGAVDGANQVEFTVRPLEGGTNKEALTVRVYLMSEIPGTKPVKAYEYLVNEGEAVKAYGSGSFTVDEALASTLVIERTRR